MSNRDRIALSVVAGALLLAGLWFLLISPKREEASQLGTQVTEARAALDQTRSDLARFQQARAEYRDNYAVLAEVGKAAPAAQDATATLLFQLGATARSEDVSFRSFADAEEASPADASATAAQALPAEPFSFDYIGPFFRLSDFLGALQRYVKVSGERIAVDGRLLRIDGFSLGEADGGKPPKVSIQATAFSLPEGESALGGATPAGPAGASTTSPPTEGGTPAPATATVTGGTP